MLMRMVHQKARNQGCNLLFPPSFNSGHFCPQACLHWGPAWLGTSAFRSHCLTAGSLTHAPLQRAVSGGQGLCFIRGPSWPLGICRQMSDVDVLIGGMLISFLKSGSSSKHWLLYVLSRSGTGVRDGAQFPPCHYSWTQERYKRQH